ncbi:hypothetical protein KP806_14505 [Paenibacillus sp. N4]|uniref:hypothetical protein n=1 Tax=Paenibacillus vietnamensis TaxID=2590547 RepID=UPI001CD0B39F|nr:hypothetical protein [Paenibacillus vietnamensis]MCA0756264.1 hypothetical protein [Paenibacillus vietnamensis]
MKKIKQPGENISLKTKKTEDPLVMQWLNAQTNLMDSLRYLMEKEICENGVRNLQMFIPMERNVLNGGSAESPSESVQVSALDNRQETAAASEISSAPAQSEAQAPGRQPEPAVAEEEELDDEDIEAWI